MAVTRVGTAIHCENGDTVSGPLDIVAVHNNATTSATITANSVVIWSAGSVKETTPFEWRGNETLTIAVTGGGSITILTRVR